MKYNKIYSILTIILCSATFVACKNEKKTHTTDTQVKTTAKGEALKLAYVDIDSMQNGLEYFQNKKKEFEGKERAIAAEMERYQREIQSAMVSFQNKIKSKNISEVEAEQTQRKIEQMQMNAAKKQESLSANFMKQQASFNEEFLAIIEAFLAEYNKENNYDFIFSQGQMRSILYHKPQYDITADVTAKMNEWIKNKENQSFINEKLATDKPVDTTAK